MSIVRKVKSVERLFHQLDTEINGFQNKTELHCLNQCGNCCTKPDIDASPLEFLPLAFHWFINHQADEVMAKLKNKESSICIAYTPLSLIDSSKGRCSTYPHRGLICRLFGYGANRDKFGNLRLVTCKLIREGQLGNIQKANDHINSGEYIPIFTDYYQRLLQIDFQMGNRIVPINQAILEALEAVLGHYAYRPFPKNQQTA